MSPAKARPVRVAARLLALSTITVFGATTLLVAFAPTYLLGHRGTAARTRLRRIWTPIWSKGALAVLGVRCKVGGPRPGAPFLLATNHLGYLDVLLLGAQAPCVFVAKSEVRSWPVWGPLARLTGTMFVARDSARDAIRVVDAMAATIEAGDNVVIFPEGTSSGGHDVLPIRPALLEAVARTGRPLHYASISYETGRDDPPAADAVCWWGDHEFWPHLKGLFGLDRIEATLRFGSEPLAPAGRKRLAVLLENRLRDHLKDSRDHLDIDMATDPTSAGETLARTNRILLREGIAFIQTLPRALYLEPSIRGASSVGTHFRHVLDHYETFLTGLTEGRIDYTRRSRSRELETDLTAAGRRAEELVETLREIDTTDRSIAVRGLGDVEGDVGSTTDRELHFVASHTLHHFAIIALLCRSAGQPVPSSFGVAPSTLAEQGAA